MAMQSAEKTLPMSLDEDMAYILTLVKLETALCMLDMCHHPFSLHWWWASDIKRGCFPDAACLQSNPTSASPLKRSVGQGHH